MVFSGEFVPAVIAEFRIAVVLHCGHALVFAGAASAQPDASLQGICFDTIMPSK